MKKSDIISIAILFVIFIVVLISFGNIEKKVENSIDNKLIKLLSFDSKKTSSNFYLSELGELNILSYNETKEITNTRVIIYNNDYKILFDKTVDEYNYYKNYFEYELKGNMYYFFYLILEHFPLSGI